MHVIVPQTSSLTHNILHVFPQVGKELFIRLEHGYPRTRCHNWRPNGGRVFDRLEERRWRVDDNIGGKLILVSRNITADDVEYRASPVFLTVNDADLGCGAS